MALVFNGLWYPLWPPSQMERNPNLSSQTLIQMPAVPPTVYGGSSNSISRIVSIFGIGYIIIIAFGFVIFLSALVPAVYVCYRACASYRRHRRTGAGEFDLLRVIIACEENDRRIGEGIAVGMDRSEINSCPKFRFEKMKGKSDLAAELCVICLCEFREEDMVRMMPDCGHYFHLLCIDEWLLVNGSCPVCRSSPLSEVVAPSQLSAYRAN